MKNNFKKNGRMVIRFETVEERREIIRILEEQRGFHIEESLKKSGEIGPLDTRTFVADLKWKKYDYSIRPFIGAAMMGSGIRAYSAREFFRIAELGFRVVPRFPVFHIPHAGWQFPPELAASVCVPEEEFRRYHDVMSDTDVWRFVPHAYYGGHMTEKFGVSRLLCDVERFIGPEEEMERYGMGFCYEQAWDGKVIKRVTDEVRAETRKYYDEHHRRMDFLCARHPRILLIDLHSFSEEALPEHLRERAGDRIPDLCIGADRDYTPPELVSCVERCGEEAGLSHMTNTPYSGTFVPNAVMRGEVQCDLISVMLEINKRIYLDGEGKVIVAQADRLREMILNILCGCSEL